VKSCVLLAGLGAAGRTRVTEPKPTRDHTERLLCAMGAPVQVDGLCIAVEGRAGDGPRLAAGTWRVPGDFSSAAFWFVAAAGRAGAQVAVDHVGLNPRRTAFLDVLKRMGADVRVAPDAAAPGAPDTWEPAGRVTVNGGPLRGTTVGGAEIPNLIDELPLVAALGALATGPTVIRDAGELRVKESDRIASTVGLLHRLGAAAHATGDGMVIEGGGGLQGGVVSSAGDHRIAMAAAVLGLFATGPVRIEDTACVATSYPGFWDDRERLAGGGSGTSGEEG
jgi:3-phosphoshikimate 1-carboxyvinyltransferase